jgi:hypothetical protein
MADYYPLISRAVAGLEKNNGENRRALYERARAALLAQLRGVTPALNESDITRERLALEESIRKVEAESARQFVETMRQPPAPKVRPIEPREGDEPQPTKGGAPESPQWDEDDQSPPPRRYVNPPSQAQQEGRPDPARRQRPAVLQSSSPRPDQRQSESVPTEPPPQARHPLRRPAGDRRTSTTPGLKDFRNVDSETNEPGGASAKAEKPARDAYPAVPTPAPNSDRGARDHERAQSDRPEPRTSETGRVRISDAQHDSRSHQDYSEPMLESSFGADEARQVSQQARRGPPPPLEDEDEYDTPREETRLRRSYRDLIKGLVAAIIILGIGGVVMWQWPTMVALYRSFRAPPTEIARDTSPPATPKKTQERIEPGSPTSVPSAPTIQQPATVAQKVVLYEEDPADPNGKRFVGSAIWRTETVTPGPGQPPELAIRADVEVPERKLAMTWSLRRNTDKGLPASHTVEIMFKLPTDFPSGGISNVPGILMKQAEQTRGVPLAGLAVKVTNGFYLIGLSNVDTDRERNLQLLKERGWFDIPVVYNNNRRAILAMEKGTPGDRVFADAFKAWKQ